MGRLKGCGKKRKKQGINWIQRFVETNKHTNSILIEVPHRYDLIQDACVNKEVEKYNSRIWKHMKVHENAEVMKVNLDRRGFTKHGQHMNAMGKELMAKRIVEAKKHILKICKKTTIGMKWKEDPSKDNQGPGEAKNGVGEGRDATENQNDSVQAEDNNSRQKEKETVGTASRRSLKIPVTRRDDFLWTATNKTVKVEKKKVKNSSQIPQNKSKNFFSEY
jgi:hypothetical protein